MLRGQVMNYGDIIPVIVEDFIGLEESDKERLCNV
jgi:hypothetical protein